MSLGMCRPILVLRRFPLKVRSAKIIYQKPTQRTVTFCILFEHLTVIHLSDPVSILKKLNVKPSNSEIIVNSPLY